MRVERLSMRQFRNHTSTEIEFGNGINALLGNNGQGKTNVIEAVSYLGFTKSFYATNDATVLQIGSEGFDVEGTLRTDAGIAYTVRAAYRKQGDKQFTVNGSKPETLASVIGLFPMVVLSPENNAITFGGPAERRKFMDLLLSQISRSYLEDSIEYRRVLKQRNKLLLDAKLERSQAVDLPGLLEPWTQGLSVLGAKIVQHRLQFVLEFQEYVQRAYRDLVDHPEEPGIRYVSLPGIEQVPEGSSIRSIMLQELERRSSEERRRGTTLVGPHRDDLVLSIDGIGVQQYASQGQHKTLLIALKVAEFLYLGERRQEVPVFLLDDVFSELDRRRSELLLNAVSRMGQTIITTTDESVFHGAVQWNGENRKFFVEAGNVTRR